MFGVSFVSSERTSSPCRERGREGRREERGKREEGGGEGGRKEREKGGREGMKSGEGENGGE